VTRGGASAALAIAGASLLAGACGERTVDTEQLEGTLKRQLDRSAGVTSRAVECPANIPMERGRTFNCTLVAPNGDRVRVDVRLTNDEGGFSAEVPRQ
jgi:hypothetical protein